MQNYNFHIEGISKKMNQTTTAAIASECRMMSALVLRGRTTLPPYYSKRRLPATETIMHRDCSDFMWRLGWDYVAHEWEVVKGQSRYGCGDMVFQKGPFVMIMEAKRRNSKKVYEQAQFYAAAWLLQYAQSNTQVICYGVWTPYVQEVLGVINNKSDAAKIFWDRLRPH